MNIVYFDLESQKLFEDVGGRDADARVADAGRPVDVPVPGHGCRLRRGCDVVAGGVLDRGVAQPRGLSSSEVDIADSPGRGLDDLRHP